MKSSTAKRRMTIGDDPLDSVVPTASKPVEENGAVSTTDRLIKERLTVHVPIGLINGVKNAVYWTPGMTLAGFAEEAFQEYLLKLEDKRGEVFPPRRSELKGGRPLK